MRFALNDDHDALRLAARDILEDLCPPAAVRAAWSDIPSFDVWDALRNAGALAVMVAASEGGLGLDASYLTPVLVEAGRVALPHPLAETAMVAAPLGVVGRMVATDLGMLEVMDSVESVIGNAVPDRRLVPAATYAESFLLEISPGELRLFEADEVVIAPVATVDTSRHCGRVTILSKGLLMTDDPADVRCAFDSGVLAAAAQLLGLSQRMLELTITYVKQRHQFGKPVGSFQAIKHHLANARLQLEFAAPAVTYAAHCLASDDSDTGRAVSQAKYLANEAAWVTGRVALQCHGAIGYTTEYDLHLYLKRSWALLRSWGSSDFHADRVANSL